MKQRHQWELEKLESVEQERVKLEQDLEMTEERQFNMLAEPFNESRGRSQSIPTEFRRTSSSNSSSSLPIPSSPPATSPNASPMPSNSPPQSQSQWVSDALYCVFPFSFFF